MIALAGAGRALHLAQQRVHLLRPEAPAGAHRMMAGHGGEHTIEPPLQRRAGAAVLGERGGEVAQ